MVLHKIPTVPYAAGRGSGDEESREAAAEWAICMVEFEEGEAVRVLPPCGHGFRVACIDKWLHRHSTCPSCRRILSLRLPPDERCSRCGARPHAGDAGWKLTSYSGVPPLLP